MQTNNDTILMDKEQLKKLVEESSDNAVINIVFEEPKDFPESAKAEK